jgi:hypothetical protein
MFPSHGRAWLALAILFAACFAYDAKKMTVASI